MHDAQEFARRGLGRRTRRAGIARTTASRSRASPEGSRCGPPAVCSSSAGGSRTRSGIKGPGSGTVPSVEEIYTPDTLPGLGAEPTYLHAEASAALDWRTSAGYSRRGGAYGVTVHDFADHNNAFGFRRVDYDAIQHIPLLRDAWVLSLHARIETTDTGDDEQIPFFILPALGGGSTLRGFPSWRFRDNHSLLMQAKTARDVFILNEGGAEVKSYSSAGQAVLLLFLVPPHGAFASRVNREQLVQWVTIFFVSNVALFLLALGASVQIGVAYFLWVGIFNLMVIAQFWAFATDLYTPEQGKAVVSVDRRGRQPGRLGRGGSGRAVDGDGSTSPDDGGGGHTDRLRHPRARRQPGHPTGCAHDGQGRG